MIPKHYYLVIDVETCPLTKQESNSPNPKNSLVYDIGFAIIDRKCNLYAEKSYVVEEIFCNEWEKMTSAYYCKKIPQYIKDISAGKRILKSYFEICAEMLKYCKEYPIRAVIAHNAYFDITALNTTIEYLTCGDVYRVFPKNIEIWDTMKMANSTIAKAPLYKEFCFENDFVTKHKTPRPQVKAETLYRFITQDLEFSESHTGLEDVKIEIAIFDHCTRQHKSMNRKLFKENS